MSRRIRSALLCAEEDSVRPPRRFDNCKNLRWPDGDPPNERETYGKQCQFNHLLSAMAGTVQDAEINAPRTHGFTILVSHHAGQLMEMREIVDCPGRQKFPERDRTKRGMRPSPCEVFLS